MAHLRTTLAAQEDKLLACIHCGLCLEACPTYVLTGDENDGPRGRIYLMRAVAEDRLATDSVSFERHIDRCLGCRACEQVCPAGVEYGELLEAGRAELFSSGAKRASTYKLLRTALRHLWLHPARLRFAFAVARTLRNTGLPRLLLNSRLAGAVSHRLEFGLALLQSSAPVSLGDPNHNNIKGKVVKAARTGQERNAALLFTGCVGEGLFSRVNKATARVLETNGYQVNSPARQVCCGALHAHAGDLEGARTLARQNIEAFGANGDNTIVTSAGGCGAMLATYGHLLADDETFCERARKFSAQVRDISQQLASGPVEAGARVTANTITYDASCHLLYGQHAEEAPLEMLKGIPDLSFSPLEGSERCCGGAGIYNLLEPELSRRVLGEKLAHVKETGARILTTGNPGCQMQIGAGALLAGMDLRVCHPIELLDEAYKQAGLYEKSDE